MAGRRRGGRSPGAAGAVPGPARSGPPASRSAALRRRGGRPARRVARGPASRVGVRDRRPAGAADRRRRAGLGARAGPAARRPSCATCAAAIRAGPASCSTRPGRRDARRPGHAAGQPRHRADRRRRAAAGAGPRRPAQAGARRSRSTCSPPCPTRRTPPAWSPAPAACLRAVRGRSTAAGIARRRRRPSATGRCAATASRPGHPPAPASAPGGSRRSWPAHRLRLAPPDSSSTAGCRQWMPPSCGAGWPGPPPRSATRLGGRAGRRAGRRRGDPRPARRPPAGRGALRRAARRRPGRARHRGAAPRARRRDGGRRRPACSRCCPRPWPPGVADAVFEAIEAQFLRRGGGLAGRRALRAGRAVGCRPTSPPGRRRWSSATATILPTDPRGAAVGRFASVLRFRHEMIQELT